MLFKFCVDTVVDVVIQNFLVYAGKFFNFMQF